MSIFDSVRKGFRFFLMSMGVSTYPRQGAADPAKAPAAPTPAPRKPE